MTAHKESEHPDNEQSFVSHLIELRNRLLHILYVVTFALIILFPFSNSIYLYIAAPLMQRLPTGSGMIAVGVATPFMAPFKLTLLAAVVITIPYTLYQIWSFIAPGLYLRERRLVMPLLISSTLLFYVGIAFAYYLVFPIIFSFLVATAPPGIAVMTDISQYLDFVIALFLAFGIIFEIPIATVLLVWMGILTPEMLIGQRSYVIVAAFTIGMFLTPPDPFSQTLLAVPMWLLFEAGVYFSHYFLPHSPSQPIIETNTHTEPLSEPILLSASPTTNNLLTFLNHSANSDEEKSANTASTPIVSYSKKGEQNFYQLTDSEMEAELDAIAAQEIQLDEKTSIISIQEQVEMKIRQAHALRQAEDETGARVLLYQVLTDGNEQQRLIARNILEQLDTA